jgi:D-alanyl-D-alanine carboxypeptidase
MPQRCHRCRAAAGTTAVPVARASSDPYVQISGVRKRAPPWKLLPVRGPRQSKPPWVQAGRTRMRNLSVLAALLLAGTAQSSSAQLGPAELAARVNRLLDSLERNTGFSGVVMIVRGSDTVLARASGDADRERRRPNTLETAFNIGSINKAFTALAIRQLAAAGTIHLDSTLGRYWPDYPNPAARGVTIRHLLTHRSGVGGDIFAAPAGRTRHALRHNRDFLQLIPAAPLQFEPGTSQRYSNAGYVILGALIERLSGEDYYRYIQRHVYEPAGMRRSGHFPVDSLPPNTAIGYTTRGGDGSRANTALLPGRGSAAGGGYSTAGDLLRFVAALRAGRIREGGRAGIGIAGGAPGLNASLEGDLPGGYDLAVLANLDPPAAERVAEAIRQMLGARD